MDYYLDIRVEPDLEVTAPALLNNLFAKFHRFMAQSVPGEIAVSFPEYGLREQSRIKPGKPTAPTAGRVLRLHGSQTALDHLMTLPWLKGLRDYTQVSDLLPVPENIEGYRTVYRIQKKSPHNLRKRAVAKGRMTEAEAWQKIPDENQQVLKLPYLQLQSLSNHQVMRIFIALGELQREPVDGTFSSYGLSREATVPWF
ncbi:CRISPR-associated endonuclease Cas6/Csy4 [Vibrio aerogenes CECT 7868]|uniref:CRISPR-associated endonuclease Cas6/Csy4 n=1 Tax=Vibrio aerogenes CECT 7868 TaxID=1216006 RepID=A0A1M5VHG0_9VIBR|nr:type I-F CRISPR-associated endoribonuclease Cas6/Csy4 [Vibrio aerogenes]SHH74722.1 CRISPR-associated endonuclease Cas6/Csy4 [Vibrio aerogenes CECT 7868]